MTVWSCGEQISLESFTKSWRGKIKVFDVGSNLVSDLKITNGEGALPKLGSCFMATAALVVLEEQSWRHPYTSMLNLVMSLVMHICLRY